MEATDKGGFSRFQRTMVRRGAWESSFLRSVLTRNPPIRTGTTQLSSVFFFMSISAVRNDIDAPIFCAKHTLSGAFDRGELMRASPT